MRKRYKFLLVGVVGIFALFFIAQAVKYNSPTPVAAASPTATPGAPITFDELVSTYNQLTGIQRTAFLTTLPGRQVHWKGTIYDVSPEGVATLVMTDNLNTELHYAVRLKMPHDTAVKLERNQAIGFDAVIVKTLDSVGLTLDLDLIQLTS